MLSYKFSLNTVKAPTPHCCTVAISICRIFSCITDPAAAAAFVVRNITVITNTHAFQPHSVSQYRHQTQIFVISEKPSVSSVQARKEQEAAIYRKKYRLCGFSHPTVNTSLLFRFHQNKLYLPSVSQQQITKISWLQFPW